MWRDIAMANRQNLSRDISSFITDLDGVRQALEQNDARAIQQFFETAQRLRDQWTASSNSPE
jgi:prephenate dehydrogenase